MKAREWLERGSAAADPFEALSNYWRGFNNLFAGKGNERDLISSFLRAQVNEQLAQELLDVNAEEAAVLLLHPTRNSHKSAIVGRISKAPSAEQGC